MPEVVFIVEEFDRNGTPITLADKFYANFPDVDLDQYYNRVKQTYTDSIGRRIKFQTYDSIENFNPSTKYFYFCPIAKWSNDFHTFLHSIKRDKAARLIKNNVAFLLCYDNEHLPSFDTTFFIKSFEWLQSMIWDFLYHINPGNANTIKFHFLSASEITPGFKQFFDTYFQGNFKFHHSPTLFSHVHKMYPGEHGLSKNLAENLLEKYLNSPKHKQFLNLNMMPRYHRDTFMHGLRAFGLMDEGYISRNKAPNSIHSLPAKYQSEYARVIRTDMLKPLDIINLDVNGSGYNKKFATEFFDNSCYDIVSETGTQYEIPDVVDIGIISEKTCKSLAFGRPFMINGGPHCLDMIKKFGFETYDFLFDESYDQSENLMDRQEIIIRNVINHKGKLNDLWQKIQYNKDILIRNQSRIFNFDVEEHLIKELTK